MSGLFVYPHLGMGDQIICNGLVRHLADAGDVLVACHEHYLKSVRQMYSDMWNIRVFSVDAATPGISPTLRLGFSSPPFDHSQFDREFYRQAGVPFEYRWRKFRVNAPAQLPVPNAPFVFVHDKPDWRIEYNDAMQVVRPHPDEGILSYIATLESAREIHCVNSAFAAMADSLCLSADRLVFYAGGRPVPSMRYKWEIA